MKTSARRQQSISKIFAYSAAGIILFSSIVFGYLMVQKELHNFKNASQKLQTELIRSKKDLVRGKVDNALAYIEYAKSLSENRLKNELKKRTYEAYEMANFLYDRYKESKTTQEIKQIIHDALYAVQWDDGRGYYFAENMQGVELVNRNNPELEGVTINDLQDSNGKFIMAEILDVVRKQGEGFCSYHWNKPGEPGVLRPKYSYVKHFAPMDWVIGTGKYLDEVEMEIKKEVLQRLAEMKYGQEGYIFIGQWDGLILSKPAPGKNLWNIEDPNGVKIVQELIKAAKINGGYVEYVMPEFKGQRPTPKISYAQGVSDWQWFVGAGIHYDEIEGVVATKHKTLKRDLQNFFLKMATVILAFIAITLIAARFFSMRLQANIGQFTSFFEKAATQSTKIDQQNIFFDEFEIIAKSANDMVKERDIARKAYVESEERFRLAIKNAPVPMVLSTMEGELEFVNNMFIETFGYTLQDIPTMEHWWPLAYPDPEYRQQVCEKRQQMIDQAAAGHKEIKPVRWQVTCKDGAVREVEFHNAQIGNLAVSICNDLTEQIKTAEAKDELEVQLRQAQKLEAIGTMAGGIAHDFNNILTAVIGYTELVKLSIKEAKNLEYLDEVLVAAQRAKELVQQILAFSRSKTEDSFMPLNVSVIIKEALKFLRATTPSTIDIKHQIDKQCGFILADHTQVHQIIMNLCTNAVHAMEKTGGTLDVRLDGVDESTDGFDNSWSDHLKSYVKLTISDTGHGIDEEIIERIFDPYFTTKPLGKGTGMGLSVVHGIVENLGGTIDVKSNIGSGTTFILCFPKTDAKVAYESPSAGFPELPRGTERVMLVDDEEAIVKMTKKFLEWLGYVIHPFTSSVQALSAFEQNPDDYDLVLTDQTMPRLTGAELAVKVMLAKPDIPVIICTGYSSIIDKEATEEIGCKGFVLKPYNEKKLAVAIRKALDDV